MPQYARINGWNEEPTVENQIYVEGEKDEEQPIIEVLLSDNVPGILRVVWSPSLLIVEE